MFAGNEVSKDEPPVAKNAAIKIAMTKRREIMRRTNGNYAANCSAIVYADSKAVA
jgi:hypothetical protein